CFLHSSVAPFLVGLGSSASPRCTARRQLTYALPTPHPLAGGATHDVGDPACSESDASRPVESATLLADRHRDADRVRWAHARRHPPGRGATVGVSAGHHFGRPTA